MNVAHCNVNGIKEKMAMMLFLYIYNYENKFNNKNISIQQKEYK